MDQQRLGRVVGYALVVAVVAFVVGLLVQWVVPQWTVDVGTMATVAVVIGLVNFVLEWRRTGRGNAPN